MINTDWGLYKLRAKCTIHDIEFDNSEDLLNHAIELEACAFEYWQEDGREINEKK